MLGWYRRRLDVLSVLALILLIIDAARSGERVERLVAIHGPTAIEGPCCRSAEGRSVLATAGRSKTTTGRSGSSLMIFTTAPMRFDKLLLLVIIVRLSLLSLLLLVVKPTNLLLWVGCGRDAQASHCWQSFHAGVMGGPSMSAENGTILLLWMLHRLLVMIRRGEDLLIEQVRLQLLVTLHELVACETVRRTWVRDRQRALIILLLLLYKLLIRGWPMTSLLRGRHQREPRIQSARRRGRCSHLLVRVLPLRKLVVIELLIIVAIDYYLRVTELRDALLKLLLLLLIEHDVVSIDGELAIFAAHVVERNVVLLEAYAASWLLASWVGCIVTGRDHELRLVVLVAGNFHGRLVYYWTLNVELLDVAALDLVDVQRDIIIGMVQRGRILRSALDEDLVVADFFLLTWLAYIAALLLFFHAVDGDAPQG